MGDLHRPLAKERVAILDRADEDEAADDGVGHPAAFLADGLRQVREELDVDGRGALEEEEGEDQHEREDHEPGRQRGEAAHHVVHDAPAAGRHSRVTLTAPPTDHTSRRASAFTATVTRKSSRPTSISAAR